MITVKGRELVIPKSEEQIGTTYDNNSEVRHIRVNRVLSGGMDISRLNFKLDLEHGNAVLDTCLLDAEIQENHILLTWTIPDSCVSTKGTVWIAVRAYDENGSIKWATNKGAVYVGHTIFDGDAYTGNLSELEQLEERIKQRSESLDANEGERQTAEAQRKENEERRVSNEAEWQRQAEVAILTANKTVDAAKAQVEIASQKAGEAADSEGEASGKATIAIQKAGEAADSAMEAARSADRAEQAAGCDGTATSISTTDKHGLGSLNVQGQLDSLAAPVFDDSGAVQGISGFQDFLNRIKSGMGFLDFFRNLKAGLKFILHTGQLVNNGLCNESGKYPLDAAYGKTLKDLIDKQNSNLGGKADKASLGSNITLGDGWIQVGAETDYTKMFFSGLFQSTSNKYTFKNVSVGDGYIQLGSDSLFVRIYFDGTIKAVNSSLGETIENTTRVYSLLK